MTFKNKPCFLRSTGAPGYMLTVLALVHSFVKKPHDGKQLTIAICEGKNQHYNGSNCLNLSAIKQPK